MPLFYLIPFKLQSDAEHKINPPPVDFKWSNVLLYGAVALLILAMFAVFIVLPAILSMRAAVPAG
jgi:hypothetical protein